MVQLYTRNCCISVIIRHGHTFDACHVEKANCVRSVNRPINNMCQVPLIRLNVGFNVTRTGYMTVLLK